MTQAAETKARGPVVVRRRADAEKNRPMRKTLAEMRVGSESVIARINGSGPLRQRLLDMGIMRGTRVRVERRAPLGDPIEILVKGALLAIRESEARHILIEDE